MIPTLPSRVQRKQFFDLLFSKTTHEIEFRALPSRAQLFTRDFEEAEKFFQRHKDNNLYFGVCTREGRAGSKIGCRELPAFWVDIDFKDLEGGQAEAEECIAAFTHKPDVVICSGNGFHGYWVLEEPEAVNPSSIPQLEGILKGFATSLRGDSKSAEVARILRIPGTKNFKDGLVKDVTLLDCNHV